MSNQQLIPQTPLDPEQEELRSERRDARMERRKQRRRARLLLWGSIGCTIVLLGFVGAIYFQVNGIINPPHAAINNVPCDTSGMTVSFHIHAHLTIYVNGTKEPVPQGIGIPSDGTCIYWLHTHTSDGIIHIEAPQQASNEALDDFLAIWVEGFPKLGYPPQLLLTTGWKIYTNGVLFTGAVNSPVHTEVPLASHDAITLEYGANNPPPDKSYIFPADLPQ
ncbi:MAG: hypothetical protein ACYDER_09665 [Ktedonobacteraceae bacterium]